MDYGIERQIAFREVLRRLREAEGRGDKLEVERIRGELGARAYELEYRGTPVKNDPRSLGIDERSKSAALDDTKIIPSDFDGDIEKDSRGPDDGAC